MDAPTAAGPGSVVTGPGPGGLDTVTVSARGATARLVLQGAHLLEWAPRPSGMTTFGTPLPASQGVDASEQGDSRAERGHSHDGAAPPSAGVLFTSERSAFEAGTPIRGGIPVCFPWFGPGPVVGSAMHGFARTTPWTLTGTSADGDDVELHLALRDGDVADASAWPHPFDARLDVRVGSSLTVTLTVTNTGSEPVTFQQALHTYLSVGDVREVTVHGLDGLAYADRVAGSDVAAAGVPLRITAETDRIYPQPGTITVADPVLGRTLTVTAEGSANAVVWNPWTAKAAALPDLGDDEWTGFLCVETANVLDDAVTLAPAASSSMSATLAVRPGA